MNPLRTTVLSLLSLIILVSCTENKARTAASNSVNVRDSLAVRDSLVAVQYNPAEATRKSYQLDTFFRNLHKKHGFNGTVLIAQYGKVLYKGAFGYADLSRKDTLTEATSFQLASVSKQFTAVAVMKLKEMGKLHYDDDVKKYLPDFPYEGVTVRQLLCHRSGLPNYMYFCDDYIKDRKTFINNGHVIRLLAQHKPNPYFTPNRRFMYSNTGYCLLASITEKVSGKPFPQFMEEQVFKPLGMNHTRVFTDEASVSMLQVAKGYSGGRRQYGASYQDGVVGDKNVYSTAEDLFKWDRALYTNRVVSQATLEEAFTPASPELKVQNYGYGWRLRTTSGGDPIIFHGGWWHGYKSYFMRNRKDQSTVIVLSNVANSSLSHLKFLQEILYPFQEGNEMPSTPETDQGAQSQAKTSGPSQNQAQSGKMLAQQNG